jgi:hypothetical protein
LVLELIAAKPEHRATEASKILDYMSMPAFSSYVWVRSQFLSWICAMFAWSAALHCIARSFCDLTRVLYGWLQDELCRTRKNKPLVGLAVVVDMINAQGIFPGFSVHFRSTL